MSNPAKSVRYAVVGLGSFAQLAVLPAFRQARKNSVLSALVSGDPAKAKLLSKRYGVKRTYSYDQYDQCLKSGDIDAVYIALPNYMHREFAVRAALAGINILCEKPLAITEDDCKDMIDAARRAKVKLMTAYRLHFEEANLAIIRLAQKGAIGDPRYFTSAFSHQVRPGDIRTSKAEGGGGLWDLGVYCINAARYLFREEPVEVFAMTANSDPKRFHGVDEIAAATLRFPDDRFAQFVTSQGASDCSQYRITGTKGDVNADPIYEYAEGSKYVVTVNGQKKTMHVPKRDQVAPELVYFSDCIQKNKMPEPSGEEGRLDVRVIQALYASAKLGRPVRLEAAHKSRRPSTDQEIRRPAHEAPSLVHAHSPSQ